MLVASCWMLELKTSVFREAVSRNDREEGEGLQSGQV